MNMRLILLLVLGSGGCVDMIAVRASAVLHAPPEKLQIRLGAPRDKVVPVLTQLFERGGLRLVNAVDGPDSKVYLFQGTRVEVTTVRGGGGVVVGETNEIGSWFAAR